MPSFSSDLTFNPKDTTLHNGWQTTLLLNDIKAEADTHVITGVSTYDVTWENMGGESIKSVMHQIWCQLQNKSPTNISVSSCHDYYGYV